MASFSIKATVRGYHTYKDICAAVVGEEFPCKKEVGNTFDHFAIVVIRGDTVIGHVQRKILSSIICSLFSLRRQLNHLWSNWFEATLWRPSTRRAQNTMRCVFWRWCESNDKGEEARGIRSEHYNGRFASEQKEESDKYSHSSVQFHWWFQYWGDKSAWVQFGGVLVLTIADKKQILDGEKLNDCHIDLAQNLLKQQFSETGGLQSTLMQAKPLKQPRDSKKKNKFESCVPVAITGS